ncbi:hypothetical protein [uncultured Agrococcus sp.]|uniref:vWA domain-containing protein n=1 Tax=uncultured Agrococcus sp. TaxID=382258 RepID=UPI0025EDB3CC|nr:hypothetical protein [uncultured Agrococcus sp.]
MGIGTVMWWWWVPIVIIVVVLALIAGFLIFRRRRSSSSGLPVAHVDRLTGLKAYRSAMREYRFLTAAAVVVVMIIASVTAVTAARPATVDAQQNEDYKRDILLCLDVSGSMVNVDAEIVRIYKQIVQGLSGERIGMRIWDASGYLAFPMTSDYDYIMEQLDKYEDAFEGRGDFDYRAGTSSIAGASLVGDGLAGCATDFANLNEDNDRPRSIILATDNFVNGNQVYSLEQAGQLAIDNEVRVYAINPAHFPTDEPSIQLQEVVEATGGEYFPLDFGGTVRTIIDEINALEAGYIQTPPEVQVIDNPANRPMWIAVLMLGLLGLAWRARL